MSFEGFACKFHTTFENNPYLAWLFWVIHPMVRNVPHLPILRLNFFNWNLLGVTTANDVAHKGQVICLIFAVRLEPSFQFVETFQGDFLLLGNIIDSCLNG